MEFIEAYRGVVLYKGLNKSFPYNGLGIVWQSSDLESLKSYINRALDTGDQFVNERGALTFTKH